MADAPEYDIRHIEHANPVPSATREQAIADPGFGKLFTDHMVRIDWHEDKGWYDARMMARGLIELDPSASVLHYAQEIFEGLKAYRHDDGSLALFRPEENARRFNRSAARLAMPDIPEAAFLGAIRALVLEDRDWFPSVEGGSLYIRPFMIATEAFLGVRPAKEYAFMVILSPAGGYFKSGAPAISIRVAEHYTRAAPGGTGFAKCGGNYAASLVPQGKALASGHDQVVFLDAAERKWIEELGGMNLFFVFEDGRMVTPPLGDTILAGITRDSILTLAREEGLDVVEERYSIDRWRADAESGKLLETMACGTAAVITPVGKVTADDYSFQIGSGGPGQLTQKLREKLVGIQTGTVEDRHGWITKLG